MEEHRKGSEDKYLTTVEVPKVKSIDAQQRKIWLVKFSILHCIFLAKSRYF